IQEYYMQDAVNSAKYVALKHAGKEVSQKYIGIYVMSVLDKSDFKNKIQVGDTITNVNGKHYSNATGYQNALAKIKAGEKVTITYQRDGKNHKAIGKTMKLPQTKRTGIGITLANRSKVKTNEKIS
ncbi:PDZ domain-containing protein, partial [Lactobacillus salivarius]|nr:PDZ domain-containing protein [Ligilactobacillus salivarius]